MVFQGIFGYQDTAMGAERINRPTPSQHSDPGANAPSLRRVAVSLTPYLPEHLIDDFFCALAVVQNFPGQMIHHSLIPVVETVECLLLSGGNRCNQGTIFLLPNGRGRDQRTILLL